MTNEFYRIRLYKEDEFIGYLVEYTDDIYFSKNPVHSLLYTCPLDVARSFCDDFNEIMADEGFPCVATYEAIAIPGNPEPLFGGK